MESQPQSPEFRHNPKNFNPCVVSVSDIIPCFTYLVTLCNDKLTMLHVYGQM